MVHHSFARLALLASVLVSCGGPKRSDVEASKQQSAPAAPAAAAVSDPRAEIFVRKGCPQCHSISAFGVKSPTEVGPDLTLAYEDVQNRFSMKLEEFLHNPTGTMQVVLSSQIQLSTAERDSIIRILKRLHEESEDKDDGDEGKQGEKED